MSETATVKCGKCGSDRVVTGARVSDRINELGMQSYEGAQLVLDRHPAAIVFKGSEKATLRARVCAGCGTVELYTADAESLYSAYRESLVDRT